MKKILSYAICIFFIMSFCACGGGTSTTNDSNGDNGDGDGNGGDGNGAELIADVGTFLTYFVTKDSYYNDLDAIYAVADTNSIEAFKIPLEPGGQVTSLGTSDGMSLGLLVQDDVVYWISHFVINRVSVDGGQVNSGTVDQGKSYTMEGNFAVALPNVYFSDAITDALRRFPVTGGASEYIDQFPLGGNRSVAGDLTNIYWIGADDGTYLKSMPVGGGGQSTLLFGGTNIYYPSRLKTVQGASGTILYWMDVLSNGNDVIRKFENGQVSSIINAQFMIDFAVADDAVYWSTADYIGRFDLATSTFTYPVDVGSDTIRGFGINGDYIYYTVQDYVYRVPR